jgi:hypothetical protein
MSWKQLIEETLGAISIYAFLGMAIKRVSAGLGSEAEQQLVECLKQVAEEYKGKVLLEVKAIEAADLAERQRRFDEKWGVLPSGHV